MSVGFPQAAGIMGELTAAGLTSTEIHDWFQRPHEELRGLSPASLIAIRELVPGTGVLLLELSRQEASRRRAIEIDEVDDRELAEADEQAERRDIERDEQRAAETEPQRQQKAGRSW